MKNMTPAEEAALRRAHEAKRQEAAARYAAVKHLSDEMASAVLGIGRAGIRCYRRQHPDARPDGWTFTTRQPVTAPQRAASAVSAPSAHVEAPKPPRPSSGPLKRAVRVVSAFGEIKIVNVPREPWGMA